MDNLISVRNTFETNGTKSAVFQRCWDAAKTFVLFLIKKDIYL